MESILNTNKLLKLILKTIIENLKTFYTYFNFFISVSLFYIFLELLNYKHLKNVYPIFMEHSS